MVIVVFYYYVGKKQHLLASLRKTERNIFVPSGLVTGVFEELPQIPNTPIHRDANHKFADYFLGAGLPVQKPISIELTKESLSQLMQISPERVHISSDLIERLLEVFPFDIFPKK